MAKCILGLERPGWLWLLWVLIHAAVWFVGMGFGGTLPFVTAYAKAVGSLQYAIPLLGTLVANATAEWLILRKWTRVSVWWVPATTLGWLIAYPGLELVFLVPALATLLTSIAALEYGSLAARGAILGATQCGMCQVL